MMTSPAYKAVFHTPLQSAVQSSPHCCQQRKILPLSWEPPRILSQLVKWFLTYLVFVKRSNWPLHPEDNVASYELNTTMLKKPNIIPHLLWPQPGSSGWPQGDGEENVNMTAQKRACEYKYDMKEGIAQLPTSESCRKTLKSQGMFGMKVSKYKYTVSYLGAQIIYTF